MRKIEKQGREEECELVEFTSCGSHFKYNEATEANLTGLVNVESFYRYRFSVTQRG